MLKQSFQRFQQGPSSVLAGPETIINQDYSLVGTAAEKTEQPSAAASLQNTHRGDRGTFKVHIVDGTKGSPNIVIINKNDLITEKSVVSPQKKLRMVNIGSGITAD